MKFVCNTVAILMAIPFALAAPPHIVQGADILKAEAEIETQSTPAPVPMWDIEHLQRRCASDDSSCTWTFSINTHLAPVTEVTYIVKGPKASQANGGPSTFGNFTLTSGWSGQFGTDKGFTTFSAVENETGLIAYPAYTDAEVKSGGVVDGRTFKVYCLSS